MAKIAGRCRTCGEDFQEPHYSCKDDDECFSCWHWGTNYEADQREPDRFVVVDGSHYRIGGEDEKGFRGFAGHKFVIEFFDGRRVVTTNLWHQGKISPFWRKKMPDNAKFVEEKKGGSYCGR